MTLFETLYDIFYKRILEDPDFFEFTEMEESEVIALIEAKAFDYMIESISSIYEEITPTVDFYDYDETEKRFNFDLTGKELQMLASLMFEKFLSRDFAKLKIFNKYFSTNEISLFSPANERKTFLEMYTYIQNKNAKTIKSYGSRDRLTNELKSYSGGSLWT